MCGRRPCPACSRLTGAGWGSKAGRIKRSRPSATGNRQYISVGNLAAIDRVSLILVDYPHRSRLKIYAHAEEKALGEYPALTERLLLPGYRAKPERALILHLEAFDWNCPQHITPRFTQSELAEALAPVRERLAALEAENKTLREKLAALQGASG